MKLIAKKEIMEFHFTLLRKSDTEIDIMMYNTFYRLVKVPQQVDESAIGEVAEEWRNAADNKMNMSDGLAKAVVEAVNNSN
ncbi:MULTISPECIES: hypothetical protein [Sphingobacterium]|uniref:hypothetical protein n=1 Tax=Sphingobacterium TaxID=28453 RepID=UPI0028AD4343|nr:hypothetical protein [Sphingobacterium multivorum]